MNTAWHALQLYHEGSRFLQVQGKVTLRVNRLEPALVKRAVGAIKRGFGTASQGPTQKLLRILAKVTGYNPDGYPWTNWNNVVLYAPTAARDDYAEVCDKLETLMHLTGSANRQAWRNKDLLLFSNRANLTAEKRTQLRAFMKEQMARWMIYRQPMLDFIEDGSRNIVWDFDSDYKETRKEINSHE